jgi:hypothetical protein
MPLIMSRAGRAVHEFLRVCFEQKARELAKYLTRNFDRDRRRGRIGPPDALTTRSHRIAKAALALATEAGG